MNPKFSYFVRFCLVLESVFCCTSVTSPAGDPCAASQVCDPNLIRGLDSDLLVTAPLGPEACVEDNSRASVTCNLNRLRIVLSGGGTIELTGTPNTVIAECDAGQWKTMTGLQVTGIDCAPCTDVCQTSILQGSGLTVEPLVSAGECIQAGDNQASVVCDQTELIIALVGGTTSTNTGSPNRVTFGCNSDGSWRTSAGEQITGLTCQACTEICDIAALSGGSLTVTKLVGSDQCIAAGSNQASFQCNLDSLTITTESAAGIVTTTVLDGPVTFLPECAANGNWLNSAGMEILSLTCSACINACNPGDLQAEITNATEFSATLVGSGSCVRENTQAVLSCTLDDLVFEDAGGNEVVTYTGGTATNPVTHNVECVGGTWQFDGNDLFSVRCVTTTGGALPRSGGSNSPTVSIPYKQPSNVISASSCIAACTTHGESLLTDAGPQFTGSNIHPGCADLKQAEEGNTLKASCRDFATVQFAGGSEFERDTFESDVELICTKRGWGYFDLDLAIEEYLSIGGDRRMECY